ncbi:UDP-glucose-4-epimerase [Savitreella phatthalungensis]
MRFDMESRRSQSKGSDHDSDIAPDQLADDVRADLRSIINGSNGQSSGHTVAVQTLTADRYPVRAAATTAVMPRAGMTNSERGQVLVTGGAGYIGSHTVVELIQDGQEVVIVDNFYNSSIEAVNRIEEITGIRPIFHQADVTDYTALDRIFREHPRINSVIHFAALKAVGESSQIPLEYYRVNVGGTITLLRAMSAHDVTSFVFSSSATVYGDASVHKGMIPIPEECPINPNNPYGRTKATIEGMIMDHAKANPGWKVALLRYFNPVGAHPSGRLGEDPLGVPNNLLPFTAQVAVGRRPILNVFGNDYDTPDGTPIRDYIHVCDLADAHLIACKKLLSPGFTEGCRAWNIGSGHGSTVLEVVGCFNRSVGRDIPYQIVGRRAGDVLNLTAKCDRAKRELGFVARYSLQDACDHTWRFIKRNPKGMDPSRHADSPGMEDKFAELRRRQSSQVGDEHSRCDHCGR